MVIRLTSDIDTIRNDILEPFFNLTTIEGLSIMEALSFSLVRIRGLTPLEASVAIKELTGKDVSNFRVSVYVDRGRRKLLENENVLDTEEGEMTIE